MVSSSTTTQFLTGFGGFGERVEEVGIKGVGEIVGVVRDEVLDMGISVVNISLVDISVVNIVVDGKSVLEIVLLGSE